MSKNKKQYRNFKAHFFNKENQTLHIEQIIDIFSDQVETNSGVYSIEDAYKYFDESSGNVVYVFAVDLPAKIEATKLKSLRRSNALHRIFDYDVKTGVDMFKWIPYIIIIMLIVFK